MTGSVHLTPGISDVDATAITTCWPYAIRFKEERREQPVGGTISFMKVNGEKVLCASFNDSHKVCYDADNLDAMASFLVGRFMAQKRNSIYPFIFQLYRVSDNLILNAWRVVISKHGQNNCHYTDYDGVRNVRSILRSMEVKHYE
mmetsp:Transcript_12579/g.26501  ORF Transcript_12579/g.26501 Transcript_12579/m.26501 type:complete len:145 (+) Transcript_12579:82-516(+)